MRKDVREKGGIRGCWVRKRLLVKTTKPDIIGNEDSEPR